MELPELRRLVARGEGLHLEFKRKAKHPDKLAREVVAFANTEGGIMLIGVDDDRQIYGLKFPDEEKFALNSYLQQHVFPAIALDWFQVKVNRSRQVLGLRVGPSEARPHFIMDPKYERKYAYVRVRDMSVQASREWVQLMRMAHRSQAVRLRVGEPEKMLLQHLEEKPRITFPETQRLLQLNKRRTSSMLIRLVDAGLLRIQPSEKGDYFSLREEAFG